MKAKILIIENSIHVTGALNAVLRTSMALRVQYDFVFVLPVRSKASVFVKEKGFQVVEIPMQELSKRWYSVLFYLPNLIRSVYLVKRVVKEHHISIVHVNDFYNLIMPVWRLCGGVVRYVCHVNFLPNRFPKLLRKLWISSHLRFSSKIIAVSHHVLDQLPASNKVVCIPNALPSEENSIVAGTERKKILLFVGNFMEGKGQDWAIRSFALIASVHSDWKLRMVGGDMGMNKNGIYKEALMTLAKDLGIERQVEWSNFSEDTIIEYRSSSIALNFSKSESFSLTVQEAMFYGCSVIATRSGGPEELIEHDLSGLLVSIDDISAMGKAMTFLIENPEACARMGINAARSIREKCKKTNTIDKLESIYRSVIV